MEGHYVALTQESRLASKIAGAIKKMDVGDLNVQVEDFPVWGRGALEGRVGARQFAFCCSQGPGVGPQTRWGTSP